MGSYGQDIEFVIDFFLKVAAGLLVVTPTLWAICRICDHLEQKKKNSAK